MCRFFQPVHQIVTSSECDNQCWLCDAAIRYRVGVGRSAEGVRARDFPLGLGRPTSVFHTAYGRQCDHHTGPAGWVYSLARVARTATMRFL